MAESNWQIIPPGGWFKVTCGLTACTPGSASGPTLGNEYGITLPFYKHEGLAVASIARDVVVEMTPPRDDNAR